MTDSKDTSKKNWLLPSSPEELEQFVKRTLGGAIGLIEEERAAVYSRVSVIDPNARSYSMEYQPDRSEEYAVSKGWRIIAKYEDPDRTGRNSRRPGLQALIRDIKAGRVSVVVVHRLDRLYRNLESLLRFLRFLKKHRVRLVSVTEQIDTDSWWGCWYCTFWAPWPKCMSGKPASACAKSRLRWPAAACTTGLLPMATAMGCARPAPAGMARGTAPCLASPTGPKAGAGASRCRILWISLRSS